MLSYALKYSTSLWKGHGDDGYRKTQRQINGYFKNTDDMSNHGIHFNVIFAFMLFFCIMSVSLLKKYFSYS